MRYSIFLLFILLTFGCKSDNSSSSETPEVVEQAEVDLSKVEATLENGSTVEAAEVEVKMDEVIDQNALAKKLIVESKNEEVAEEAKVENKIDVKLKGKSEAKKEEEAKLKMESTKEMIDGSLNKGLTCEQMLAEQKKIVDEFETSGDKKLILKMAKKQNDPFFKECLSQESFQTEIDNLAMRLEEIMDKM